MGQRHRNRGLGLGGQDLEDCGPKRRTRRDAGVAGMEPLDGGPEQRRCRERGRPEEERA